MVLTISFTRGAATKTAVHTKEFREQRRGAALPSLVQVVLDAPATWLEKLRPTVDQPVHSLEKTLVFRFRLRRGVGGRHLPNFCTEDVNAPAWTTKKSFNKI